MAKYEPLPGTIPYRAIEYMKSHPAGKWFSIAVLADAIGQDRTSIRPCMISPVRNGLVLQAKRNGLVSYCLADHQDATREEIEIMVAQDDTITDLVAPDLMEKQDDQPEQEPEQKQKHDPAPVSKPPKRQAKPQEQAGFEVSYSSRDVLKIAKGGQVIELARNEFSELQRFVAAVSTYGG